MFVSFVYTVLYLSSLSLLMDSSIPLCGHTTVPLSISCWWACSLSLLSQHAWAQATWSSVKSRQEVWPSVAVQPGVLESGLCEPAGWTSPQRHLTTHPRKQWSGRTTGAFCNSSQGVYFSRRCSRHFLWMLLELASCQAISTLLFLIQGNSNGGAALQSNRFGHMHVKRTVYHDIRHSEKIAFLPWMPSHK